MYTSSFDFGNPEGVGGLLLAKIPTFCIPKSLLGWLDVWESPFKLRIHSRFPKMLFEAGTLYRCPRPSFFRSEKLSVSSDKPVLPNNLGSQFPLGFCSSAWSHILIQPRGLFWSEFLASRTKPGYGPPCSKEVQFDSCCHMQHVSLTCHMNTSALPQNRLCLSVPYCRVCPPFRVREPPFWWAAAQPLHCYY